MLEKTKFTGRFTAINMDEGGVEQAGAATATRHRYTAALLVVVAVALPFAVIYRAAIFPSTLLPFGAGAGGDEQKSAPAVVIPETEKVELQTVLKNAAIGNKTVILTTLNAAWSAQNSVIDLFLESFTVGEGTHDLRNHLVIIALDDKAYARCTSIHPHCFALTTEGVDFSAQKNFMTDGYLKMMWRRIDFLRVVLEMGYSFIFSDADIMWFRSPLPHFYQVGDFQISCDHFGGNPADIHNAPNGGFNYVRSNNRTIEFYKFWYKSREKYPRKHDQDVLNIIKYNPFIKKIGLEIRFLPTIYFGGICEPSRDFNKVCTMHANCCIGLERKVHDLRVMLDDWKEYKSLPPQIMKSQKKSWRVPQNCSLAPLKH